MLTAEQRANRALLESEWQAQIVQLAELLGWHWAHFRAARTTHGWRTPVSGPLGAGFPDLVLAHPSKRRIIFAETKREQGATSAEQDIVLDTLRATGVEVYVWRPSDLAIVIETLGKR